VTLARAGLRLVRARKLETAVMVLLVAGIVASYASILVLKENIAEQVYLQTRQSMGHVLVLGYFTDEDAAAVEALPGVAEARLYPAWYATTVIDGDRVSVPLVGETMARALVVFDVYEGRWPKSQGEAVFYHSLSAPPGSRLPMLGVGDRVEATAASASGPRVLELEVVGVARGYAFLGGAPIALVVPDETVLEVTGGVYTMLSVVAESDDLVDQVAEEVLGLLEERGVEVHAVFVNKKENNPVVAIFEGGLRMLDMLALSSTALAAVIPAALGAAQVAREARLVAVLKSIGVELYALPWLARAALGAALGALAAPALARLLLERVVIGDNEIARIIFSYTPFNPHWGLVAENTLLTLALVAAAALVPVALAYKVREAEALHFIGIRGAARARLPAPNLRAAIHAREALARPWRLAGLALALATVAAVAGAAAGLVDGVYSAADYYEIGSPVDLFVFASTAPSAPGTPMWERLASAVPEHARGYAVYDQFDWVNALGLGERFRFKTLLAGDPQLGAPLIEGRYPEAPNEAVVTRSIALLLGLNVGDTIEVSAPTGAKAAVEIVGVTSSMENVGYLMLLTPEGYKEIVGREPGASTGVLELDLPDTVDPAEEGKRIVAELEADPLVDASFMTRYDVANALRSMARILYGVLAAVSSVVAALALVAVAGIVLVDVESRARELAVYNALGLGPAWAALGTLANATAALLAAALLAQPPAQALAEAMARASAAAIGYVEPSVPQPIIAHPLAAALTLAALAAATLLAWARARSLPVPRLLRGE